MPLSARLLVALLVAAALQLRAAPSRAQDATALVDQGLKHLDRGEYREAIDRLKRAYARQPEGDILGLLGDAYRLNQDCQAAADAYQGNLEQKPKTRRRGELRTRLAEMKACATRQADEAARAEEARRAAEATRAAETERQREAREAAAAEAGRRDGAQREAERQDAARRAEVAAREARVHRRRRILGMSIGGAGLALVGVGTYFGLDARAKGDEVEQAIADAGGAWSQEAADLERRGQRNQRLGIGSLALGGAAVVGGTILFVIGLERAPAEGDHATARVSPDGADLGWAWTF